MVILTTPPAYSYSEPLERLKASLDGFGLGDYVYADRIEKEMVSTLYYMLKSHNNYNADDAFNFVKNLNPKKPDLDWNDVKPYVTSVMTPSFDQDTFEVLCGSISTKYMPACFGQSGYFLEKVYVRGVDAGDIDVDWFKGDRYSIRFLEANRDNLSKLAQYYMMSDAVTFRDGILARIEVDAFRDRQSQRERSIQREQQDPRAQATRAINLRNPEEQSQYDSLPTNNVQGAVTMPVRQEKRTDRGDSPSDEKKVFGGEVSSKKTVNPTKFKAKFYRDAKKRFARFDPSTDGYTIDDQCRAAGSCNNLTYTTGKVHPFTNGYKRWDVLESDYAEIANALGLRQSKISGIKLMAYHGDGYIAFKYNKIWFVHKLSMLINYSNPPGLNQDLLKIWNKFSERVGVTYTEVINGVEYYTVANDLEYAGMRVGSI